MKTKYTPIHSLVKYIGLKLGNNLKFEEKNVGQSLIVNGMEFSIFREIYLLTDLTIRNEGAAIFQVVFYAPERTVDTIIKRTDYTIPFFVGLPGFCNKQFMVDRESKAFSGEYEWATVENAKDYANSYAVSFMRRRSKPCPLSYKIIEKSSGKTIEERILK